ncbi:glycosyltransferase family 2 protein [Vibrio astriarenae]
MLNDLVSIITPTYNSSDTILETYQSILAQTYTHWEWIVTDDCSSDDTYKLLEQLAASDSRIKIYQNPSNLGAAIARNNSISYASGQFLAFIDSDDLWMPNKLAIQLDRMVTLGIDFSFTAYMVVDVDNKPVSQTQGVDLKLTAPMTYRDMLQKKATLGCSTVMLRKSAFKDLEMPLLRSGQDYAFWLKLLRGDKVAYPILQVLMRYRIVPGSVSRNKYRKALRQWQIYREIEKLSLTTSLYCFVSYALRAVAREVTLALKK